MISAEMKTDVKQREIKAVSYIFSQGYLLKANTV